MPYNSAMTKINTLIFDFGNVLVNLHEEEELRAILEDLGKPASGTMAEMILMPGGSEVFWDVMRGKTTEAQMWQMMADEWDIPFEKAKEVMQLIAAPNRPNYPLIEFIENLKGDYKIGVLSNAGDATLERLLQWYPYNNFVDVFVISAEVKLAKPDAEIYELALRMLDSKGEECVFVDDLLENIEAAEQHGILGIWHRENDETIARLKDILGEA
jgi:putative hydrolase of the HAD superfamily